LGIKEFSAELNRGIILFSIYEMLTALLLMFKRVSFITDTIPPKWTSKKEDKVF
jgi:hypothetical protein